MLCQFPEHNFFCFGFLCLDPTMSFILHLAMCSRDKLTNVKTAMVASQMLDQCQQFSFQRLPSILFVEEVYYNAKHFYYIEFN